MVRDAQELKEKLGSQAKQIIADGLGFNIEKHDKVKCPLHDDKVPSMSWYEKGLIYRCHACQGQIDIYEYFTKFKGLSFQDALDEVMRLTGEGSKPIMTKKTEYKIPKVDINELTDPFIQYMKQRKINLDTLNHWKVKQRNWNGQEVYVFQYFNEKNILEYVSYRGLGKNGIKGGCEKDTKPILWGIWHVDKSKPLVITEGQPDAMAVYQAGYKNVVSVPNGSNNLKWIQSNWEWLQDIPEFLVFADNDKPGIEMARNIQKKLKNVKILISNRKDANEVLFFDGEDALLKLINDKLHELPQGIVDVSEVPYKTAMEQLEDTIETGFIQYDRHVEDWKPQELTIIFGRNGEGKTTFISQVISHNLEKGVPTFLYSGEMSEQKIQDWIYRQLIGNRKERYRTIISKYRDKTEPKPETLQKIKEWHKGKFFLYDRTIETDRNLDKFFDVLEIGAKKFGIKLFVIDNLMAILEENADSLYSDQANFVQRCKFFAIDNNVHIVLLAHPNKEKQELINATKGNLQKTDISGSNNIPNKADNIIAIERLWGEDRPFDCIVTSLKDRNTGQRLIMNYFFSPQTLRFYNEFTKQQVNYSWTDEKQDEDFETPEGFIQVQMECPF